MIINISSHYYKVLGIVLITSMSTLAMEVAMDDDLEVNFLGIKLKKGEMRKEMDRDGGEQLSKKMVIELHSRITQPAAQKVIEKFQKFEKDLEFAEKDLEPVKGYNESDDSLLLEKQLAEAEEKGIKFRHIFIELIKEVPKEIIDFPFYQNAPLLHTVCSGEDCMPLVLAVLNQGADANAYDQIGTTPLIKAASATCGKKRIELITLLCSRGAKINMTYTNANGEQNSLLQLAAYEYDKELVELLLVLGAKINNPDVSDHDSSPLIWAARRMDDNPEIAQLLIEHEADVNFGYGTGATCHGGQETALSIATTRKNVRLIHVLLTAGAKAPLTKSDADSPHTQGAEVTNNSESSGCTIF